MNELKEALSNKWVIAIIALLCITFTLANTFIFSHPVEFLRAEVVEVVDKEIHRWTTTTFIKSGDILIPIIQHHTSYRLYMSNGNRYTVGYKLYNNAARGEEILISYYRQGIREFIKLEVA